MQYSYLAYSLFFLAVLGIVLGKRRDLFKDAIPAFMFGAVCGPLTELFYTRDYWHPPSVLHIGAIGVEDSIFGTALCGLTLVAYPCLFHRRLGPIHSGVERHLRSFGVLGLMGAAVLALIYMGDVNSVFATAVVTLAAWLSICALKRDLLVPGFISGALFAALATVVYVIFLNIFVSHSELDRIWLLHGSRLGITILGNVPVSELAWFFGVGAFLSTFELFVNKRTYEPYSRIAQSPTEKAD